MPAESSDEVRARLSSVTFPGFRHSILRYGLVTDVRLTDGEATIVVAPASRDPAVQNELRDRIRAALADAPGIRSVRVVAAEGAKPKTGGDEGTPRPSTPAGTEAVALPGVGAVIAVSSCKGGVGKSTVAVNLTLALKAQGHRVALLDADIYGPSVPLMMGAADEKPRQVGNKLAPIERYGVSLMSMGFFLDDKSPVVWRGPMVMGAIRQFLRDVAWGDQDFLVVDMPPGTGDAALTLAQQVPLTGAVIVTTPQEVALADVERGIAMFRQVHVPILGIVENMSIFVCPDCGEREEIFGAGGGESLSRQFDVPVLARVPIAIEVREGGDAGRPVFLEAPDHPVSQAFHGLAAAVATAR